ncbi:MAG: hypothetical protein ACRD3O_05215 [Terriglobia bacterium]
MSKVPQLDRAGYFFRKLCVLPNINVLRTSLGGYGCSFIVVLILFIARPQIMNGQQEYAASIGVGYNNITDVLSGSYCNGPLYSTGTYGAEFGTVTLRGLSLIKNGDGSWKVASVTEQGPTSYGAGSQPGVGGGGSTYVSDLPPVSVQLRVLRHG